VFLASGQPTGSWPEISLWEVSSEQFLRCEIELPVGQLDQQVWVGIVGERVFRRFSRLAAIEIAVGQHQSVATHFFEEHTAWSTVVLMLLKYRSSVCGVGLLNASPLKGPIFGMYRKSVDNIQVPTPGLT